MQKIKFINFAVIGSIILSIIMIVSACKKYESNKNRIGIIGPLTGEGATYGQSMKRGFELVFGDEKDVHLVYEDDKLSAKEGVAAINKLISADKVQVILGSAASSVTLAMAPIAEKNHVILFSSISTSDDLRKSGEYIFRNVPRNEIQGITAANFLYEKLKVKSVVILKKNDEYATNLSTSFRNRFVQLGGKVLLDEAYRPSANDFKSIIVKIRTLSPQAIYIPGNYQEVALLLKQAYEAGIKTIFIGGDGSYSPELTKIAGTAAEGSYYTIMSVKKDTDYYKQFQNNFLKKYNQEPDVYDAYAYEAAQIIQQAIKNVGYDAPKLKDYLLSTQFESLTGKLKFDADGEVDREYGIVKVKDGKFVEEQ